MSTPGPPPPLCAIVRASNWRRSLTFSDSHGSSIEVVVRYAVGVGLVGFGEVDDAAHRAAASRLAVGERGAVIAAVVPGPVLEFRRLPVRAVAAALPDQLQVAVEALEARRAQARPALGPASRSRDDRPGRTWLSAR